MKKSLFFVAAASALMLTACTSENDVVQSAAQQQSAPKAVGFDVYTQGATEVTRAGQAGIMTTSRLQRSEANGGGFGVYGFYTDYTTGASSVYADYAEQIAADKVPNFMVNEKILWNDVNQGWYYNPLKYWPNETTQDSQTTPALMEDGTNKATDKLTFFAYAPYVNTGVKEFGITGVTDKTGVLTPTADLTTPANAGSARAAAEPSVSYYASLANPNKGVDLLWGVAPAGGLTYTAVNGTTINKAEGTPLIDMVKPDVNTNMKFLFQHALARIGVKAVAAIDQIGAGGTLDPNTKITIKSITLEGYFGETGVLNLDNTKPNVANWVNINGVELTGSIDEPSDLTKKTITIEGAQIADHVKYTEGSSPGYPTNLAAQQVVGVTTVKQDVLAPVDVNGDAGVAHCVSKLTVAANSLAYSETTPYYTNADCAPGNIAKATIPTGCFTIDSKGVYTPTTSDLTTFAYPAELKYYTQGVWTVIADAADATAHASYTAYRKTTKINDSEDFYVPTGAAPAAGDYVIENATSKTEGIMFYAITQDNKSYYASEQAYTKTTSPDKYTPKQVGLAPDYSTSDYVIVGALNKYVPKFAGTDFYKRDANYFMVVPVNNVANLSTLDETELEAIRTVKVTIEYYITTEDASLNKERSQTRNVIVKDVIFPSIANGKSYNLNLVLGLTSVKMEAEVDDWKVINVNGNLPQNTAE